MTTLFISDLHLTAGDTETTRRFVELMDGPARAARELYILGDLFEAWIGDDDDDPGLRPALEALARLTSAGVPCLVMHGNRDFLLGPRFCAATGCRLLGDYERIELYGERGAAWLRDLPALIWACEQRWSLAVQTPFKLSYNYVAPARRADGVEVVLKLGVPNPELLTEIESLRLYDGRGICQLLDADPERGILLLDRLVPGTMLAALDDEQATSIAAGVMRQLWRPVPADHPFPTVAKWAEGMKRLRAEFGGGTGPFDAALVERAEGLFADLLASMGEPVLLHGDLHHENILAAERDSWLALDPKGVVGEREYEVGALLRNPDIDRLTVPILARRVDQLAGELGFDRQRVIGWGLAQAVLSAWWVYEDHGYDWEGAMRVAGMMGALKG